MTSLTQGAYHTLNNGKYNLEYYINMERDLSDMVVHSLSVKYMTGLLTPHVVTMLVFYLRVNITYIPLYVHMHNKAGTFIASIIVDVNAGSVVVDAAMDVMSGLIFQLSLGGIVAAI